MAEITSPAFTLHAFERTNHPTKRKAKSKSKSNSSDHMDTQTDIQARKHITL